MQSFCSTPHPSPPPPPAYNHVCAATTNWQNSQLKYLAHKLVGCRSAYILDSSQAIKASRTRP
eukprot:m.221719 g.221719  ORF g.221719 m.221719 type:complete len:63 (-) comp15132_c0_seq1:110-298(-)